ncbi:MAG TPA: S8 family peptidase [Actinomycetota bacterium]|nr:S8 family peptidase [Actinomycetota bacterium]
MSQQDRRRGSRSGGGRGTGDVPGAAGQPIAGPELIVMAAPDAGLRARHEGVTSVTDTDVSDLTGLISEEGIQLDPLFGPSEERVMADVAEVAAAGGDDVPDLSRYYRVQAPSDRLEELALRFMELDVVEAAYVQPISAPPSTATSDQTLVLKGEDVRVELQDLNTMTPMAEPVPPVTPDFTTRQGYLNPAPEGIDARYAWTVPGGRGAGVRIIDLEWGWRFTHEDLLHNQGGVLAGTNSASDDHGTAVLGEISGDRNPFGITGIAEDAWVAAISFTTVPIAAAIKMAADRLGPGDIILLEVHRFGPRSRWLPVEWWPADFEAIRYAVTKGIVVVEAGGNGGENLDDPFYNTPQPGFPTWWRNPLNVTNPSSGAIMVGAGNPPPGTHGLNQYGGDVLVDRARCNFSNYGARVDAQGWGWLVTSTGYGDLQGDAPPPDSVKDRWYTNFFSGTSSASPIVVGALACVQGALRARGRIPLSPARARELLRATGSPQQDGPGRPRTQWIGNRPNLRRLIPAALATAQWLGVQFTGTVAASSSARWFTYRWPAHWHVVWTVVPTTPKPGGPQISWSVQVERADDAFITYWITITNHTSEDVGIEARYAVLGW